MELHTQTTDEPKTRKILDGQLRQCYCRAIYSRKAQENCAEILFALQSRIKFWQIILSIITTSGIMSSFIGAGKIGFGIAGFQFVISGAVIGGTFSIFLLLLNALSHNYNLSDLALKHKNSAIEIWLISQKYLSLLTDLAMEEKPLEHLQSERDNLLDSLHSVYAGSPNTTFKTYKKALDALKLHDDDLAYSDQDIDPLLPEELRRPSATK